MQLVEGAVRVEQHGAASGQPRGRHERAALLAAAAGYEHAVPRPQLDQLPLPTGGRQAGWLAGRFGVF